VTALAHDIGADVKAGALDIARSKLPIERPYQAASVFSAFSGGTVRLKKTR
jgi:hypothetical protein